MSDAAADLITVWYLDADLAKSDHSEEPSRPCSGTSGGIPTGVWGKLTRGWNNVKLGVEFRVPSCVVRENSFVYSFVCSYNLDRPMASWEIAEAGLSNVGLGLRSYQGLQVS